MEYKLAEMESKFVELIWKHEPIHSGELVKICEKELNWKKPTTYTVLRRLCHREILQNRNTIVTSLINEDEYYSLQSEYFIEETFEGSLPKFIAAFTKNKKLGNKEIDELQRLINDHKEE